MVTEGVEIGHVFGDIERAPAPFIAPLPGRNALGIGLEAVAGHIWLEQVALNAVVNENTAYVLNQNALGLMIHGEALRLVADKRVGLVDQIIELGIAPGV